jgi:hypothetical protein
MGQAVLIYTGFPSRLYLEAKVYTEIFLKSWSLFQRKKSIKAPNLGGKNDQCDVNVHVYFNSSGKRLKSEIDELNDK